MTEQQTFMEEQAEQDRTDSVSEKLGKHVTRMWEIVREQEKWIAGARGTASAAMKVVVAKRVKSLCADLGVECANLLELAERHGID